MLWEDSARDLRRSMYDFEILIDLKIQVIHPVELIKGKL